MKKAISALAFVMIMGAGSWTPVLARDILLGEAQGAAPTQGASRTDMQAVCREVVVETDEGYGVSRRETRFICNEGR